MVIQQALSKDSIEKRNIFQHEAVQHVLDDYYKRNIERHPFKIWNLAVFELWCRIHIDNPSGGIPESIEDLF
jgi:hypothetical protein